MGSQHEKRSRILLSISKCVEETCEETCVKDACWICVDPILDKYIFIPVGNKLRFRSYHNNNRHWVNQVHQKYNQIIADKQKLIAAKCCTRQESFV